MMEKFCPKIIPAGSRKARQQCTHRDHKPPHERVEGDAKFGLRQCQNQGCDAAGDKPEGCHEKVLGGPPETRTELGLFWRFGHVVFARTNNTSPGLSRTQAQEVCYWNPSGLPLTSTTWGA